MVTLVADLEGNGLLDTLTKIWIISIGDPETGVVDSYHEQEGIPRKGGLREATERLRRADRTVWHHGLGYDIPAIIECLGRDHAPSWEKVIDTLVLSKLENPDRKGGKKPHGLESWGHRVGIHKVPDVDWETWSDTMVERCETDVRITMRVWDKLKYLVTKQPVAVEIEHRTSWETTNIIHRGMMLDQDHARSLLDDMLFRMECKREELQKIFPPILVSFKPSSPVRVLKQINRSHPLYGKLQPGDEYCPLVVQEFNPGSREQAANRLISRYGWRPAVFTDGGSPKMDADVLNELPYPEAPHLLEYLNLTKKTGQINSAIKSDGSGGGWLHHIDKHGRVHAGLNALGTITGRPSCSSPNVQQVDTDTEMRRCWIPTPGRVMVGVDAEGLELRCLAHYLARYDGGEYGRELLQGDIHTKVMNLWGFYGRYQTKRGEYGWLYGAGDEKLGLISMKDAHKAGRPCKVPGKTLRDKGAWMRKTMIDGIPGLGDLIDQVRLTAATGRMRGLDGRNLWIRSDHSALNTLLQSAGIIIVKRAITYIPDALEEAGLRQGRLVYGPDKTWYTDPSIDAALVMWVHDEVQLEARPECAERAGQVVVKCMNRAGIDLDFRMPIDGKAQAGASWAETH